jgi:hypothetical protein
MTRLVALRAVIGLFNFRLAAVLIMSPVLLYAWMWLIKSPVNPLYQKLAILSLIAGLFYAVNKSQHRGEAAIMRHIEPEPETGRTFNGESYAR